MIQQPPFAIEVLTRDVHTHAIAQMLLSKRHHAERAEKAVDEISELILFPPNRETVALEVRSQVREFDLAVEALASCDRAMAAHRWAISQLKEPD